MYCRKCGKEIKDNSKFCPYCGNKMLMAQSSPSAPAQSELNADIGTHSTAERKEPPTDKKKVASRPKWVIPVAVVSSVAIIGVAVYMGVKVMQKPAETAEQVTADVQKQEEKPVGSEETAQSVESAEPQEPEYPVDITLNEDEMKGITDLLYMVSKVDAQKENGHFSQSTVIDEYVVSMFVIESGNWQVPFVDGEAVDSAGDSFFPVEILDQYIRNSLGCEEYSLSEKVVIYSDDEVRIRLADGGAKYGTTTPQITKVKQVSADEIEVWGTDEYLEEKMLEPYTAAFDVIMKKNPDSMWGGYTLTEIKSWGRQDAQNATGDWKQAFINTINPKDAYKKTSGEYTENSIEENYDTDVAFKLWDMNKDGIPEVICKFGRTSAASGMLYAYNPQTNSVIENMLGGRFFTYNGEELCATNAFGGICNSIVYTLNGDGSLNEKFSYGWTYIDETTTYLRDEGEISEAEYQQYENTYTQPLEADLTYGGLIQEIQNYAQ